MSGTGHPPRSRESFAKDSVLELAQLNELLLSATLDNFWPFLLRPKKADILVLFCLLDVDRQLMMHYRHPVVIKWSKYRLQSTPFKKNKKNVVSRKERKQYYTFLVVIVSLQSLPKPCKDNYHLNVLGYVFWLLSTDYLLSICLDLLRGAANRTSGSVDKPQKSRPLSLTAG